MDVILIVDTGSSSMRGILFDRQGSIVHCRQEKYFMDVQPDGSAEQDPLEYANALRLVCESCGKFAAENRLRIAALSFTSQRSSILPLDSSGKPLSRIITWYDKRSADICRRMLELHGDEIYRIAGMRPIPVLSAPKIAWLKETHPDIYRNAHKIVGIHDYLLYLATGKFVTDDTLASRTCLMDTASRQWSPRLLALFDISQDKLCTLLPAGSIAGTVTQTFAAKTCLAVGIPLISAGGDQQCSVLGQGLLQPGQAGITVGTGAYLASVTDHPINDPEKRVNINAAVTPGHWILEASTLSAGAVYDWVNRLFSDWEGKGGAIQHLNAAAEQSPPGANGVVMLPDLAGKGCPEWNDWARGLFCNLSFSTTRGDMARAALEGVAAEIAQCHQILRSLDARVASVHVTGGLAKFSLFDQILADMLEYPVERCIIEETTAIGAFLAGSTAIGWYSSLKEAAGQIGVGKAGNVFYPQKDHSLLYRKINTLRAQVSAAIPHAALAELNGCNEGRETSEK